MIEITNEKMEKLYKMQTTLVKSYTTISAIVIFVVLVITRLLRAVSSGDHAALSAVFMIILAADVVGYFIIRKKVIPAGNGPSVMDAYKTMQNDFISDRTVDLLYRKIGEAGNYADKTKLTLLLCDTYMMRGQINEAISLLNSIDRSRFAEYPEAGMSFYDDTLSLYDLIGELHDDLRSLGIQRSGMLIQNEEINRCHGSHEQRQCLSLSSGEEADLHTHLIFQSQI